MWPTLPHVWLCDTIPSEREYWLTAARFCAIRNGYAACSLTHHSRSSRPPPPPPRGQLRAMCPVLPHSWLIKGHRHKAQPVDILHRRRWHGSRDGRDHPAPCTGVYCRLLAPIGTPGQETRPGPEIGLAQPRDQHGIEFASSHVNVRTRIAAIDCKLHGAFNVYNEPRRQRTRLGRRHALHRARRHPQGNYGPSARSGRTRDTYGRLLRARRRPQDSFSQCGRSFHTRDICGRPRRPRGPGMTCPRRPMAHR
jgi:hypothetical protein